HEPWRRSVERAAPEVVDDILDELALVGHERRLEQDAALERAIGQDSLAEAVDREHGGLVEPVQRALDRARRHRSIARALDDRPAEGILARAALEGFPHGGELVAQSPAQ